MLIDIFQAARTGSGSLFIDGKKTWSIKHWFEKTADLSRNEVEIALRDAPFQYGPWGESLAHCSLLFKDSVCSVRATDSGALVPGAAEDSIPIDWELPLDDVGQAILFRRIRLGFNQSTALVLDVKDKRKYRMTAEEAIRIRNVCALWAQVRTFCQSGGRFKQFEAFDNAVRSSGLKDGELQEIIDSSPTRFAVSMLSSAKAQALQDAQAQSEQSMMEVEQERVQVRDARRAHSMNSTFPVSHKQGILS